MQLKYYRIIMLLKVDLDYNMPLLKILPSLISQGSFTGSFSGTSSYARKSVTASYLNTVSQSLVPAKNNTYSLGTSTKKWKDIYVSTASIYFDNYPLRVAVKNNSPQLLFNTRSIVTVPSGSNPSTSSYATKALTASYALNASGGGGGSTLRTGSTYPITSSFARRAITASYALNSSGGSTLRTGSTYPITSSYARRAITASYALNASGGGSTLRTGSTYPITASRALTASYASGGGTMSNGRVYGMTLLFS